MTRLDECDIVQNQALGALSIWAFTLEYFKKKNQTEGPAIPILMPLLPAVMHETTLKSLCRRSFDGGLYKAVTEDRTLTVGLQQRMKLMADQTFEAISLGILSGLLRYDDETSQLFPLRKTPPFTILTGFTSDLINGSKRLGYWFSSMKLDQICLVLRIGL